MERQGLADHSDEQVGDYPPREHILRDLRVRIEHRPDGTGTVWMPVAAPLCNPSGALHAGALATLVDLTGGGIAAIAAHPGWIATADLTLHLVPRPPVREVIAQGAVLRAGKTTVVVEVSLTDDDGPLGTATMSFAVLPRRDDNPVVAQADQVQRATMALPDSGLHQPLLARIALTTIDERSGIAELPINAYVGNSLGAVQGGMVATLIGVAAEQALTAACETPVETIDLQVTFLALGRIGPLRTRAKVLDAQPSHGTAHVEVFDAGATSRTTAVARAVAAVPG